jgi:hypothetical protein
MPLDTIGSARELRHHLVAQIDRLSARSRSQAADRALEELGLPRDSDRVLDLRRRLAEVESLLDVSDRRPIEIDAAWFLPEKAAPLARNTTDKG